MLAKRDASLVKARQITMYLLKEELKLTLVEIGNILGGRDHTTVMHGVEKMVSLVEKKERVSEDILGITRKKFLRTFWGLLDFFVDKQLITFHTYCY